jgi:hypothetical protein
MLRPSVPASASTTVADPTAPDPDAEDEHAEDAGPEAEATPATAGAPKVEGPSLTAAGSHPGPVRSANWTHFAPPTPPPPAPRSRLDRLRPVARVLRHEWFLAVVGALALAVLMTWPTLKDPAHTVPEDAGDPTLVAYLISWSGHALLHDPANLWNTSAFFPAHWGLAFSDSFLGYAPFGIFGTGPEAALIRYNIIYVVILALAFFGMYALARQLGAGRTGAMVAGLAYGLAPWRLGQAGHLHVISTGGIALALAMLARGHGFRFARRPGEESGPGTARRVRPGWVYAGWAMAAWQITIGFGIGLVFAYVLLGAYLVWLVSLLIRRPGWPRRRLIVADLVGGGVFAAVAVAMAVPYLKVLDLYPQAHRSAAEVAYFSPPLRGFFTSPPESLVWGDSHTEARTLLRWPAEMALLPGFVLYALAIVGLLYSIWSVRTRVLLLAGVIVSIYLGTGTEAPFGGKAGYLLLYHALPGFEGLRTPGRLVVWTTLLLCLLAAGGVTRLVRQATRAAQAYGYRQITVGARLVTLIPLALVLTEGIASTPHPAMPTQRAVFKQVDGPLLVLPSADLQDMLVMYWTTDRFIPVANGASGFVPTEVARTRDQTQSFPDQPSIAYLRELGVKTVVILNEWAGGTPYEDAATRPIDGLGITREVLPDAVVFHLSP